MFTETNTSGGATAEYTIGMDLEEHLIITAAFGEFECYAGPQHKLKTFRGLTTISGDTGLLILNHAQQAWLREMIQKGPQEIQKIRDAADAPPDNILNIEIVINVQVRIS